MLIYYVMLIVGALLVLAAVFYFIAMYSDKDYSILNVGKSFGTFLMGILLLAITLPSHKYVVLKEYDIVRVTSSFFIFFNMETKFMQNIMHKNEIYSSGRFAEANFNMLETGNMFTFRDIPALDAYGKSISY